MRCSSTQCSLTFDRLIYVACPTIGSELSIDELGGGMMMGGAEHEVSDRMFWSFSRCRLAVGGADVHMQTKRFLFTSYHRKN